MTISVPDELIQKFRRSFPELNLAEIVRRGIIERLETFEKLKAGGKI